MSKKVLLAAVFLAAGCAQESAPPDAATAAAPPEVAQPAPEPCPPPEYSATPEGVTVDQPYLVRTDRIYQTRAGNERRRTSLELLEGDPRTVAQEVLAGMLAQGFREIEIDERGDGVLRLGVTKRGVGRVNISATDDRGANPAHPRSVGLVAFDMPFAPAGTAAQGDAEPPEAGEATDAAEADAAG